MLVSGSSMKLLGITSALGIFSWLLILHVAQSDNIVLLGYNIV